MAIVEIAINERIASAPAGIVLVCNNPTDTLRFTFDSEWASQSAKVARFEWGGRFIDVPFSGNEVKVPEITNTLYVNVGVYGDDIASTHVKLQCKRSILCLGDAERVPMDNTNFDQFMAAVNEFNKNSDQMVEATEAATKAASDAAKAAENINAVVEHMPNKANAYKASAAGNPVAFYPDENSILNSVISLKPVQTGSGEPAQDNIRTISARSAIKLTRCGKNLHPYPYGFGAVINNHYGLNVATNRDGSIAFSGTVTGATSGFATFSLILNSRKFLLPVGRYSISGVPSGGGANTYRINIRTFTANGVQIDNRGDLGDGGWFEVTDDAAYIDAYMSIAEGIDATGLVFRPMIVPYGNDTTYEPPQLNVYSMDIGRTIYGGSLDWETGVLTADWGYIEFDGTENGWQKGSGNCFIAVEGIVGEISDLVSNQFVNAPKASVNGLAANQMRQGGVPTNVVFGNPDNISTADWKKHLEDMYKAGTPLQLCYKLANPITIQLTTEQMLALDGMNNVYTDSNEDIVTVTYNKSLQKIIEELTNAIISLGGNV